MKRISRCLLQRKKKKAMLRTTSTEQLGSEIPSPPVEDPRPLVTLFDEQKFDHKYQKVHQTRSLKSLNRASLWSNFRQSSQNSSCRSRSSSSTGNACAEKKILEAGFYKKIDQVWKMLNSQEVTVNQMSKMNAFKNIEQIIIDAKKAAFMNRRSIDLLTTYLSTLGILDQLVDFSLNSKQIDEFSPIFDQILTTKNVDYLIRKGKLNSIINFFITDQPTDQILSIFETISQSSNGCEILLQEKSNFLEYLWQNFQTMDEISIVYVLTIFTNFALFHGKRFNDFVNGNKVLDNLSKNSYEDPAIRYHIYLLLSILICQNDSRYSDIESFTKSLSIYLKEAHFQTFFEQFYEEKFCKIGELIDNFCALIEKASNLNLKKIGTLFEIHCSIVWHHANSMVEIREIFKKNNISIEYFNLDSNFETPQLDDLPVYQWSCDKVGKWLNEISFEAFEPIFKEHQIDGDLLLSMNQYYLEKEFGMSSSFDRMRFIRELETLMMTTDYSIIDTSALDMWLTNIDPHFSIYTYRMVKKGVDRKTVSYLNENLLMDTFAIRNPIHRRKILKHVYQQQQQNDFPISKTFL